MGVCLYSTTCISRHPQLRTIGFCWRRVALPIPLLSTTSTFGLGRRCQISTVLPATSLYSQQPTTLCLKKVPTFKLSVTLSNLNRFSTFLHCRKAYEICYKTHITKYAALGHHHTSAITSNQGYLHVIYAVHPTSYYRNPQPGHILPNALFAALHLPSGTL